MTSETKDSAVLFYYEWEESFEELSDSEYRQMIQAIQKYAKSGELPEFKDRTMRSVFKLVRKAIDRNVERYDQKCLKNKENGRKGGAPKGNQNAKRKTTETTQNNQTVEKTTETTLRERERVRDREPEPEREPKRERGGGGEREAHTTDTDTTTTALKDQIIREWNQHDFVQKVIKLDAPGSRWLKTLEAVNMAGGKEEYLNVIRSLSEQAYFRDQDKRGYRLVYDWFVNPENFQNVLEGKYAKSRDKFGEGWEVVEFG